MIVNSLICLLCLQYRPQPPQLNTWALYISMDRESRGTSRDKSLVIFYDEQAKARLIRHGYWPAGRIAHKCGNRGIIAVPETHGLADQCAREAAPPEQ